MMSKQKGQALEKIKAFMRKPAGRVAVIFIGTLIVFVIIIKLLGHGNSDSAAVKALQQGDGSNQISANTHYTVEETLQTNAGELEQMRSALASQTAEIKQLKAHQKQGDIAARDAEQTALAQIQAKSAALEQQLKHSINQAQTEPVSIHDGNHHPGQAYPVGQGAQTMAGGMVWLNDQATPVLHKKSLSVGSDHSLLHSGGSSVATNKKPQVKPAFTIPANTILTGITPEQPLVGMIPKSGAVVNPQSVLFMVGSHNLAANGWHLPPEVKGIQGNALCQGVFVWFNDAYANCTINSLTFIFTDGRIATVKAPQDKPFGHLATQFGSPNIPGIYQGNAVYAAIGTGVFSGLQGFGNQFAQSQQEVTSLGNQAVSTYKNAFDSGIGAFGGSAGQAMNEWWQKLVSSTTDFVYVPNWNPKTHQILQLNAVILNQVNINYDPTARKVRYEETNAFYQNSLN